MNKLFDDLENEAVTAEDATTNDKAFVPLAERLRPQTLDEYVGQQKVIGEDSMLRRALERGGRLPSLILWGAPGTGKTTLARILARQSKSQFHALSAVFSGVKELRAEIAAAREAKRKNQHTILFIDEIHRFNKAQQDALLAAVEEGLITLIGATTENPSFELNAALLSRCRVLTLAPLSEDDIKTLIARALKDTARGLGNLNVELETDALTLLATASQGDARVALTALESAAETQCQGKTDINESDTTVDEKFSGEFNAKLNAKLNRSDAKIAKPVAVAACVLTSAMIVEALGRARYGYDKNGEDHYNLASALIKSIRNSDANAALYWLARLLEGGADPMFVARRLTILASEDVGLADPNAITQAASAAHVVHLIGMPEALYPLTQATLYLALAPKSNCVKTAYYAAAKDAQATARESVPLHLRNAPTQLMKQQGYAANYRYVHTDAAAQTEMKCLPEKLQDRVYYSAPDEGGEQPADAPNGHDCF